MMKGNVVTVVSGLPRSGTSMVMQMLAAGGFPVLADGHRAADHDNPRGYFEDDRTRRLDRDASWLVEARGRAVKIVSPLLRHVPDGLPCRVLFLRRDLTEVLASQSRMLERRGEPETGDDARIRRAYERHLEDVLAWLGGRPDTELLLLDHRDVVARPRETADRIITFLDTELDLDAMTAAVDPALHRQRAS